MLRKNSTKHSAIQFSTLFEDKPHQRQHDAAGNGDRHGGDGQQDGNAGALCQRARKLPDDAPVKVHDRPL